MPTFKHLAFDQVPCPIMKSLTLQNRCDLYSEAFPWPPPRTNCEGTVWLDGNRWLGGMWVLGHDYRGTGYYGSYPPNFLKRIHALFPDADRVLHLFSGSLPAGKHVRYDSGANADVVDDAHELSRHFKAEAFDLILADPPYSAEDARHYGRPMISRNRVLAECAKVLEPGGFIVWLDQVLPMFRKDELHLCGAIGVVRSTNHRFRVAAIFRKLAPNKPDRHLKSPRPMPMTHN